MASAEKLTWDQRNNTVDLTTVKVDRENPAYLIDKRLLDVLLGTITKGTLEDIKGDIRIAVSHADSKEDLFARLDQYIYLDKVVNMLPKESLGLGDAVLNGTPVVEDKFSHL